MRRTRRAHTIEWDKESVATLNAEEWEAVKNLYSQDIVDGVLEGRLVVRIYVEEV